LTFRDDKDGQGKTGSANDARTPSRSSDRRTRKRSAEGEVGHALRTVYDDTLKESIPPEMLDLLGKLG